MSAVSASSSSFEASAFRPNRRYHKSSQQQQQPQLSHAQIRRQPSQNDIHNLLVSGALIGSQRVSSHMRQYVFPRDAVIALLQEQHERDKQRLQRLQQHSRRLQNTPKLAPLPQFDTLEATFDLKCTWNQLNLAAMLLAGVQSTKNVLVVASNARAADAASCLARVLEAQVCIGRYVPGTITNTNQETFCEPPFIILASATEDTQAIRESSKSNTPIIAFADSTANLEHVDVPIPCNTKGRLSIAIMMYLLARQFQRHKGLISYDQELENLVPDHFVQQKLSQALEEKEQESESEEAAQSGAQAEHETEDVMHEQGAGSSSANLRPASEFGHARPGTFSTQQQADAAIYQNSSVWQ